MYKIFKEKKIILKSFINWLPLAVVLTLCLGAIYIGLQQSYRQNANNPQVQIVEDGINQLKGGSSYSTLVPPSKVEISESLSSYIIVFDENGRVIDSNALLHGVMPTIPSGVFDFVKKYGFEKITWQPEKGVRQAIAIGYYNGNPSRFVLAGRSLREVESRIDLLTFQMGFGWVFSMIASFVAVFFAQIAKTMLDKRV